MATFLWQAKSRLGELQNGEMEAESAAIVKQRLSAQKLQVVRVKKKATEIQLRMPGSTGVTAKDLMIFTRQFSTMVDAGLPLVQSLEILGSQMENAEFGKIVLDVKATVETGATLADALAKHPKVFGRLFVNLISAGETGGILDTVLLRLAEYIEKNQAVKKKVKGALVYPCIILTVSFVVTMFLLVVVIPSFQKMFEQSGRALPALTQITVDASEWTLGNIHWIALAIGGGIFGFVSFYQSKTGRRTVDKLLLEIPVISPIVRKVAVARVTRPMGTLLTAGVPLLEALDIVAGTVGNVIVEEGLYDVREAISEGKSMSQPLSEIKAFPSMVVQMVSVGESTGAMDTMLVKIADFYDEEVDDSISTMMSMLEPMIMSGLAVILGFLVISMFLPVFEMAGG